MVFASLWWIVALLFSLFEMDKTGKKKSTASFDDTHQDDNQVSNFPTDSLWMLLESMEKRDERRRQEEECRR